MIAKNDVLGGLAAIGELSERCSPTAERRLLHELAALAERPIGSSIDDGDTVDPYDRVLIRLHALRCDKQLLSLVMAHRLVYEAFFELAYRITSRRPRNVSPGLAWFYGHRELAQAFEELRSRAESARRTT